MDPPPKRQGYRLNRHKIGEFTSRNLPLSAFPNAEPRWWSADIDHDTAIEDEEDHLHFPRVLDTFGAAWGHFYHTCAKEVKSEGFGKFEFGIGDVTHLDGMEGICNI